MKSTDNWLELLIQNVQDNSVKARYLLILLVLFISAGSLYMLLNTTG